MKRVTSADGTTITYDERGSGPAVLLLHGALQTARNFTKLAEALAPSFRVIVPNRRGRGGSGAIPFEHDLSKEGEDVGALLRATGARFLFGLSSGALVALYAARHFEEITKLAIYEPPFTIAGTDPAAWADPFEELVERGRLAAAMVTLVRGTGDDELLTRLPRAVLIPLASLALRLNARMTASEFSMRQLVPTVRHDIRVQREATALLPTLMEVRCDVLLMGGERSHPALRTVLDELARRLPHAKRVRFSNVGHIAADDTGRPLEVAAALRTFFDS